MYKYKIENSLNDFEFHDSVATFEQLEDDSLVLSVEHLNIHSDAKENPHDCDMEIDEAFMTLKGFAVESFEPGRAWKRNENGEYYTDDLYVLHTGDMAHKVFIQEISKGMDIKSFDKVPDECRQKYLIGACGIEPYFEVVISFDSVVVEWNEYRKKAWYVDFSKR